jgi:hypothetical protein
MTDEQIKHVLARLPVSLHKKATEYARVHGISMNTLINESVKDYIDVEKISRDEFDELKKIVEKIRKVIEG